MTQSRGNKPGGSEGLRPPSPKDREEEGGLPLLPDLMRRAFALGLTGIFTTEHAIRQALGDTLPKDWIEFAVDQSDRTRADFVKRLAGELARVIENLDLEELAERLLEEHTLEIRAQIRLKPRRKRASRSRPSAPAGERRR